MKSITKAVLGMLVLSLVVVGAASADCGKKETHEGTLKAYDKEAHAIVVVVGEGEEVKIALTKETAITDAEGKKAEPSALVGTTVEVVSEHAKADSVKQTA